jgi:hypothetical protein
MTLSLKEDVQLRETENAWKPGRMKPPSTNEQEAKTEVCMLVFGPRILKTEYCVWLNVRQLCIKKHACAEN